MTTPAEIAAGLSEAQRRAVMALPASGSVRHSHDRHYIAALPHLNRKGLAEPYWSAFPSDRPWALTPLGLAVRNHLEQNP